MLQQDEPDDYVVATGETHSVRRFCEIAFEHVGLDWEDHVVHRREVHAPGRGRPARRRRDQGQGRRSAGSRGPRFEELVTMMVDADIELLSGRLRGIS